SWEWCRGGGVEGKMGESGVKGMAGKLVRSATVHVFKRGDEISLFHMNIAFTSGSGSLPSNTVANPKGELIAITTRSAIVLDGPTVPTPPPFINSEVDERVEETLTDPDLSEYTIKVSPPPVQKYKPPSQRDFVVHPRDSLHQNIPYPLRMLKQKQQEKDEVQIHKF
nr:hypothetical protein [Tanacetum cinerariifolium]